MQDTQTASAPTGSPECGGEVFPPSRTCQAVNKKCTRKVPRHTVIKDTVRIPVWVTKVMARCRAVAGKNNKRTDSQFSFAVSFPGLMHPSKGSYSWRTARVPCGSRNQYRRRSAKLPMPNFETPGHLASAERWEFELQRTRCSYQLARIINRYTPWIQKKASCTPPPTKANRAPFPATKNCTPLAPARKHLTLGTPPIAD